MSAASAAQLSDYISGSRRPARHSGACASILIAGAGGADHQSAGSQGRAALHRAIDGQRQGLHDRVLKVALERESRLLSGLTPGEVDTLVDLLGRLHLQVPNVNSYDPSDDQV